MYGWIITEDHLSGPKAEHPDDTLDGTGVMGPKEISPEFQRRLKAGEGVKFRLDDADGETYYTGLLLRSEGQDLELISHPEIFGDTLVVRCDGDESEWFGPLYDYGLPNAGAVSLWFEKDGKWGLL